MMCRARVWDAGDMTDCGETPTVGATGLCERCYQDELRWLQQKIQETNAALSSFEGQLRRLKENYVRPIKNEDR
jgi:hypothetical protein